MANDLECGACRRADAPPTRAALPVRSFDAAKCAAVSAWIRSKTAVPCAGSPNTALAQQDSRRSSLSTARGIPAYLGRCEQRAREEIDASVLIISTEVQQRFERASFSRCERRKERRCAERIARARVCDCVER